MANESPNGSRWASYTDGLGRFELCLRAMKETVEKRRHERTHFFLVPTEQERVRFWVFKPADELESRAGVVLDASESGLRILVDPSGEFGGGHHRVRLLVDPASGTWKMPLECTMKLVWCEPDGNMGYMAGMQFEEGAGDVVSYIAAHPPSSERRSWICCTLRPIAPER